jgi:ribosomal protein L44E
MLPVARSAGARVLRGARSCRGGARARAAPPPLAPRALQAKTTKKIVLRLECKECKHKIQLAMKRCKKFELGQNSSK